MFPCDQSTPWLYNMMTLICLLMITSAEGCPCARNSPRALTRVSFLGPHDHPGSRCSFHPHLVDEETVAWRGGRTPQLTELLVGRAVTCCWGMTIPWFPVTLCICWLSVWLGIALGTASHQDVEPRGDVEAKLSQEEVVGFSRA